MISIIDASLRGLHAATATGLSTVVEAVLDTYDKATYRAYTLLVTNARTSPPDAKALAAVLFESATKGTVTILRMVSHLPVYGWYRLVMARHK